LAPFGKDVFDLKHIIAQENGKLFVDQAAPSSKVKKESSAVKPIAEWQLKMVPGSKVTCMGQNQ